MSTFIERTFAQTPDPNRPALGVAIKDLIDLTGLPTTAGSRAVAANAKPATADAECLAGIRAAEARGEVVIVGKTGLHELAFGITGINAWFGTPINPLDPARIPGGSSSGSAVAVATGEADVALGSDTGGSVRIPAACCGVAGLKTTFGRIPLGGVWPLAASLDTVGPMARDVAGLRAGMALLDPGFAARPAEVRPAVARLRLPADPRIDAAIDASLSSAELEVSDVPLPGWKAADEAVMTILAAEAWASDGHLIDAGIGVDVATRLQGGAGVTAAQLSAARRVGEEWKAELRSTIERFGPVALPTLADDPPRMGEALRNPAVRYTATINLAGFPAVCLPLPAPGGSGLPVGLQLVGLPGGEEALLELAGRVEAAVR